MKNLITLLFIGFALLMTSCAKDDEIITQEYTIENYLGIWSSTFNCTGPLAESNDEDFVITITRGTTDDQLLLDFGDDTVFKASFDNNNLTLEAQVLNAGQSFDEISLAATGLLENENMLSLDLTHSVDEEGVSKCELIFTK